MPKLIAILMIIAALNCRGADLSIDTSTTITGNATSPKMSDYTRLFYCDMGNWPTGVTGKVTAVSMYNGVEMNTKTCDIHDTTEGTHCGLSGGNALNQVKCIWELHNTGNWAVEDQWITTHMDSSKKANSAHVYVPALHKVTANIPSTVELGTLVPGQTAVISVPVTFKVSAGNPSGPELELAGSGSGGGGQYEITHMRTADGADADDVKVEGTTGNTSIHTGGAMHITGDDNLKFTYTPEHAYGPVHGTMTATLTVP